MLCRSAELEGHVGVGDDRASLLSNRFVDHSGTLDVAGLSFAYSEDGCDAFDAVYEARRVVCWLAEDCLTADYIKTIGRALLQVNLRRALPIIFLLSP